MGKNLVLIGCGGALYVLVELCYRGRSHGSMFLLGGVLFWLIGLMDEAWPDAPLAVQMALGAFCGWRSLERRFCCRRFFR